MMRPTNIPAMAPYDAGAIAGMVLVASVTIVIILMFVNSTVFHMLALTSFFVVAGTETGRSRRRSGRGRRRAGQKSEPTDCKQNQYNLFEGYMCRTIKDFLLYKKCNFLTFVWCLPIMVHS